MAADADRPRADGVEALDGDWRAAGRWRLPRGRVGPGEEGEAGAEEVQGGDAPLRAVDPDVRPFNSRLIIDATRPWEWRDRFPVSQLPTAQTRAKALERWGWLVGKGEKPKDLP